MTTEELSKLTPEQKRIRIAEACGWKIGIRNGDANVPPDGGLWSTREGRDKCAGLPDYLNDLNAMHPVEIAMFKDATSDHWPLYTANLCNVVDMDSIISATAAQRADAFLLTVDVPMGQNNEAVQPKERQ